MAVIQDTTNRLSIHSSDLLIGELAEQLDTRGLEAPDPDLKGFRRLYDRYRRSLLRRQTEACIRELDALAARIDLTQPSYPQVSTWLSELDGGKVEPLVPLRLVLAVLCLAAALWMLWAQQVG